MKLQCLYRLLFVVALICNVKANDVDVDMENVEIVEEEREPPKVIKLKLKKHLLGESSF